MKPWHADGNTVQAQPQFLGYPQMSHGRGASDWRASKLAWERNAAGVAVRGAHTQTSTPPCGNQPAGGARDCAGAQAYSGRAAW